MCPAHSRGIVVFNKRRSGTEDGTASVQSRFNSSKELAMNVRPMHTKRLAASLCAAGLMLAAGAVHAADAIGRAAIQSQYEQDVANCKNGNTNQDRATCMREAG